MEIQWSLVAFSLLAGTGGVLMVCIATAELFGKALKSKKLALCTALVLMAIGGCASILHLAHPQNVMAAVANLGSFSGISLELIFLAATFASTLVYAVLVFKEIRSAITCKITAVVSGSLGIILAYICGHGYVIVAQPMWNTGTLAFAYLGTSLATGAFAYLVIGISVREVKEDIEFFSSIAIVAAVMSFVSVALYGMFAGLDQVMTVTFAIGAVLIGGVGSLVFSILFHRKPLNTFAVAGLVCAVTGAVCLRIAMWQFGTGYIEFFGMAAVSPVLLNL